MADQGLVNYIKRSLAAGIKRREIASVLLQAGWPQSLIDEGFKEVHGGSVPAVSPGAGEGADSPPLSNFEKFRRWLLILIGARLVLIPVQYLFLSLTASSDVPDFLFTSLGEVGFMTFLMTIALPLVWLIPFFVIQFREKSGYIIAIVFAVIMIYLNLFGFAMIRPSGPFYIFSFVYLVTGVLIITFAGLSFKYFPKRSEEPNMKFPIDESKTVAAKLITALLFGIIVIAPRFLGLSFIEDLADFGGRGEMTPSIVVAFLAGALLGWLVGDGLIDRIKRGRSWSDLGPKAGFWGGAIAQLPLYGFSGIQIIAMPVGAVAGMFLGYIGILILGSVTKRALQK